MGYDVRHESTPYLQALMNAATQIGETKRQDIEDEKAIRERQMRLAEEAQAAQQERFNVQLQAQELARQAGFDQQRQLQAQEIQGKADLQEQEYQLQNESLKPRLRYTQEQMREYDRIQNAIYKVQNATNLRPAQKAAAINRLLQRRAGITPMPELPMANPNQPSPVQEAYKERVFLDNERGGMWVLQPDDKLEFQKFEQPGTIKPADMAKMVDVVTKMLTIPGGTNGTDKPPTKEAVIQGVQEFMSLLSGGGTQTKEVLPNPFVGLPASSRLPQGAEQQPVVPFSTQQSTMLTNPVSQPASAPVPQLTPTSVQTVKANAQQARDYDLEKIPEPLRLAVWTQLDTLRQSLEEAKAKKDSEGYWKARKAIEAFERYYFGK